MVKRETVKQRTARAADLLAHYHEVNEAAKKINAELDSLKDQVRELDPAEYDGWELAHGTPRVIMDQKAVQADYDKRRVECPTMETRPPLIVRPVATAASRTRRRS
jgi:hypothetical protein